MFCFVFWVCTCASFCSVGRTKLDRSNTKDYQEREERAKRLAQEIEHNAERHGIDDTGTEEEL